MSFWTKIRLKSRSLIWTEKKTWTSPNVFKFEIPKSGSNQMITSFTAISWLSSNPPYFNNYVNFTIIEFQIINLLQQLGDTNQCYRCDWKYWYSNIQPDGIHTLSWKCIWLVLTTLTATFLMKYFGRLYGLGVLRFSMNFEFEVLKLFKTLSSAIARIVRPLEAWARSSICGINWSCIRWVIIF